jgi:tellurite resistance protein TerC
MWLHKRNPEQNFKQDLILCITWIATALLFNAYIAYAHGPQHGLLFLTGYLVELSLSVDNLFVIMMIFGYFRVPKKHQHRVLFWGIFGAFVMRALFIFTGVAIVQKFHWMMYLFGAFLIFTGLKTLKEDKSESSISENKIVNAIKQYLPFHPHFVGEHFWIKINSKWKATPLFLTLIVVEMTDVIFAVDSIPAILGITTDPFLVATSNFFAILGLRSMYFVLNRALEAFHYIKYALSFILVFVGIKMVIEPWYKVSISASLTLIISALVISGVFSYIHYKKTQELEKANDTSK